MGIDIIEYFKITQATKSLSLRGIKSIQTMSVSEYKQSHNDLRIIVYPDKTTSFDILMIGNQRVGLCYNLKFSDCITGCDITLVEDSDEVQFYILHPKGTQLSQDFLILPDQLYPKYQNYYETDISDEDLLKDETDKNVPPERIILDYRIFEASGVEKEMKFGQVYLTKCWKYGCYFIVTEDDDVVVPMYRYNFIDKFQRGLARVNIVTKDGHKYWGIINEKGEEVVHVMFDEIWNFVNSGIRYTTMKINGVQLWFDLVDRRIKLQIPVKKRSSYVGYPSSSDEPEHYEEYAGSYAQDVEGYSDEFINDAFDGDPDAYWNID